MFKVNDYVIYGLNGVCQIKDIRKDEYASTNETQYYVLNPVYENNITFKVPVTNHHTLMRAVISRDDALSLIATIPEIESVQIDDDKQRVADFKAALKTGLHQEWIKIVKTLYLEREARFAIGKKLSKADENLLNTAEKQLNEEFSIALDIAPDEVVSYITRQISQK